MAHPRHGRRGLAAIAAGAALLAFASTMAQAQTHMPNFTGTYGRDAHNFPKPYSKSPRGYGIEGGYNNELLRPWVVEMLDRDALVEKSGHGIVTAHSDCYPEGVPYVFGGTTIQILQT